MPTLRHSTFVSLLSCILWIVAANVAHATQHCTYYVDAVNGIDINLGTSETQAWKSLFKVSNYSVNFQGGDIICFRRGQRFYNFNNGPLSSNGSEGNPILFTHYGPMEAPPPVLSNARSINAETANWQDLNDGRWLYTGYKNSVATNIWEDKNPLKKATTADLLDGQWYLVPGTGIYSITDPVTHLPLHLMKFTLLTTVSFSK